MTNEEIKEIFNNIIKLTIDAREQVIDDFVCDFVASLNAQQLEVFFDCLIENGNIYYLKNLTVQVPNSPVDKVSKEMVKRGSLTDLIEYAKDLIAFRLSINEELKEAILTAKANDIKDLCRFDLISFRELVEVLDTENEYETV